MYFPRECLTPLQWHSQRSSCSAKQFSKQFPGFRPDLLGEFAVPCYFIFKIHPIIYLDPCPQMCNNSHFWAIPLEVRTVCGLSIFRGCVKCATLCVFMGTLTAFSHSPGFAYVFPVRFGLGLRPCHVHMIPQVPGFVKYFRNLTYL